MFMSGYDRRNVFKNIVLYLCVSALFILPISTLLTSLPAFAAGYFDGLSTQEKYKFYVYARALDTCFVRAGSKAPNSNVEELKKGKIFNNVGDGAYVGTFPGFTGYNNSGGYFDCNSAELMSTAVSQFNIQPQGRSSAVEVLLCKIGYRRGTNYTLSEDECINGSGAFGKKKKSAGGKDDRQDDVNIYSKGKIFEVLTNLSGYKNGIENSDPSIKYLVSRSMIRGCIKDDNPQPRRHNSKDWEIQDVDSNGNLTNSYYLPGDGQGYNVGGSNNREWPQKHYDAKISEWQCMNIYQRLVESAPKYQEALKQSATDTACAGLAGEELEACKDGIEHKGDSEYCKTKYKSDDKKLNACKQGQSAKVENPDASDKEDKKDCGDVLDSGLLGYFICPAINVAISFADGAWSIFEFLLINNPLDRSGAYYDSWTKVRDLANAILVVIFLGIVISQVSNIGISNYGIKKMLPRLVIVAVAINISYYLMQVIIDIANITGKSIDGIFSGFESYSGLKAANGWSVLLDSILLSATVVGSVGVTLAAGAVLGWPAIILFLGAMIIPAIIGIIAGLLALQVRSMLIPILAIFSPVALVAWVLPNTQKLFDKWKSMFTGLVFLYPLASIYYGGLKFAASLTLGEGKSSSIQRLMALAALFIGTFMVAVIAIKSNSIMGKIIGGIGGFANKLGASRLGGLVSNTASGMMSSRKAEFLSKGIGGRKNPFTIGAHKAMKRFNDNKKLRQIDQANYEAYADKGFKESLASGKYDSRLRSLELPGSKARIQEMTHSLISTEVKNAQISFGNASIQELKSALSDAIKNGDDVKARAAQNILLSSRGPVGIDAHNQAISESESYMSDDMSAKLRSNIQESNSGVFDKDPGLLKWASGQDSSIDGAHNAAAREPISLDKFTGMTKSSQLDRINGGGISSDQATSAINPSGSTFAKLDPEVVQALNKIANNKNNNENNNENNNSSGEKLIIATSQEDIRKALEDSRR